MDPIQEITKAAKSMKTWVEGFSFDDISEYFKTKQPNTAMSDSNKLKDYLKSAVDNKILLEEDGKYKINIPSMTKDDSSAGSSKSSSISEYFKGALGQKENKGEEETKEPASDQKEAELENLEKTAKEFPDKSGNTQ